MWPGRLPAGRSRMPSTVETALRTEALRAANCCSGYIATVTALGPGHTGPICTVIFAAFQAISNRGPLVDDEEAVAERLGQ